LQPGLVDGSFQKVRVGSVAAVEERLRPDTERRVGRQVAFQGPRVAARPNPNGALHVQIVEEIRHRPAPGEGAELLGVVRKAEHPQALQQVRLAGVRRADEQVDPPTLQAEMPDRLELFDLHIADHPGPPIRIPPPAAA
jgi:hypothetical protein